MMGMIFWECPKNGFRKISMSFMAGGILLRAFENPGCWKRVGMLSSGLVKSRGYIYHSWS